MRGANVQPGCADTTKQSLRGGNVLCAPQSNARALAQCVDERVCGTGTDAPAVHQPTNCPRARVACGQRTGRPWWWWWCGAVARERRRDGDGEAGVQQRPLHHATNQEKRRCCSSPWTHMCALEFVDRSALLPQALSLTGRGRTFVRARAQACWWARTLRRAAARKGGIKRHD